LEGTIPRGSLHDNANLETGKDGNQFVSQIPADVYRKLYENNPQKFNQPFEELEPSSLRQALLERGRERFNIYCSVCHGQTGDGDGMVVRRGFRRPPTYHSDRLRQSADGYFFDVITTGFGAMVSYANRIDVEDRWAIVAYIRALQLSQNAGIDILSNEEQSRVVDPNETNESHPQFKEVAP
jgi:mono/diheme cytochrome c family protein